MQTPEGVMRAITSGFAANDLRPLMDAVDDETVWKSAAGFDSPFRFGGEYCGRAGIADVTSNIFSRYSFRRFDPIEILTMGEVAWGLFAVECDYYAKRDRSVAGKPVRYEGAMRLHVRNGMIVSYQSFFDTASMLYQQGELTDPETI